MLFNPNNHEDDRDDDLNVEPDGLIGSRALCDLLTHAVNSGGAQSVAAATFFARDRGNKVHMELVDLGGACLLSHTGARDIEDHVVHYLDPQHGLDCFEELCTYYHGLEKDARAA